MKKSMDSLGHTSGTFHVGFAVRQAFVRLRSVGQDTHSVGQAKRMSQTLRSVGQTLGPMRHTMRAMRHHPFGNSMWKSFEHGPVRSFGQAWRHHWAFRQTQHVGTFRHVGHMGAFRMGHVRAFRARHHSFGTFRHAKHVGAHHSFGAFRHRAFGTGHVGAFTNVMSWHVGAFTNVMSRHVGAFRTCHVEAFRMGQVGSHYSFEAFRHVGAFRTGHVEAFRTGHVGSHHSFETFRHVGTTGHMGAFMHAMSGHMGAFRQHFFGTFGHVGAFMHAMSGHVRALTLEQHFFKTFRHVGPLRHARHHSFGIFRQPEHVRSWQHTLRQMGHLRGRTSNHSFALGAFGHPLRDHTKAFSFTRDHVVSLTKHENGLGPGHLRFFGEKSHMGNPMRTFKLRHVGHSLGTFGHWSWAERKRRSEGRVRRHEFQRHGKASFMLAHQQALDFGIRRERDSKQRRVHCRSLLFQKLRNEELRHGESLFHPGLLHRVAKADLAFFQQKQLGQRHRRHGRSSLRQLEGHLGSLTFGHVGATEWHPHGALLK
jgi:hypothetical protein